MRRLALACLVLLTAGCGHGPAGEAETRPVRLLVSGTVDLSGPAGFVAVSDPESLFREVRLLARRADLAVVAAAPAGEAQALLAVAGFDAVACPHPQPLAAGPAATVRLGCTGVPGSAAAFPVGLAVSLSLGSPAPPYLAADVTVVAAGGFPAAAGGLPDTVVAPAPFGRTRLLVSGLGPLVSGDPSEIGALLEVLIDAEGVIAYRLGRVTHRDFRAHFVGWDPPTADAVLLDGEWWALARPPTPDPVLRPPEGLTFTFGDLVAAALGDVTGDGAPDLAVSYRHPFRPSALSQARPGVVGLDSLGRSAHLGIFTLEGEALWAAGYIPRPVGELAACDGGVALAYTGLDDPAMVAAGAAVWRGLSLEAVPELPGSGLPGCADVDGDGRRDPVILERTG